MESSKRPRFEMVDINNLDATNEDMQGVASPTTATIATIGGQSFLLSNSTVSPANILLSLCGDNSNESDEFILDHTMIKSMKQEHIVPTQVANKNQTPPQQSYVFTTSPQFRIINQTGKPLNTTALNSAIINNSSVVNANSSLISNGLNFTPGCEIYVIKEVFNAPKQEIAESTTSTSTSSKKLSGVVSTLKQKPVSPLPVQRHSTLNGNKILNRNTNSTPRMNPTSPVTSTSHTSPTPLDEAAGSSSVLEAYKTRDDKRRAIHNEVERRRRDKIKSWIFQLKELMPPEQKQGDSDSNRTPANDSKSQILIKACEYIKSMQEEMTSLRECLTENENLRLKNQRLQNEINSLRSKYQQQKKLNNNSNILLTTNSTINNNNNDSNSDNSDNCEITLNSLNTTYANDQLFSPLTNQRRNNHNLSDIANSNAATSTPTSINMSSYGKRELIITDYVD